MEAGEGVWRRYGLGGLAFFWQVQGGLAAAWF